MTGIDGANAGCVKRWSGAPNESYIENFVSEDFGSENFLLQFPIPSLSRCVGSGLSVQNITKK